MKKECLVVMLPTKESIPSYVNPFIYLRTNKTLGYGVMDIDWSVQAQHLYILSDEKIPYNPNGGTDGVFLCLHELEHPEDAIVKNVGNCEGCRRIIATTDRELLYYSGNDIRGRAYDAQYQLPKIPQFFITEFINKFNQKIELKNVLVEYEEWEEFDMTDYSWRPKLEGNQIIISKKEVEVFTAEDLQMYGQFLLDGLNDMFGYEKFSVTPESLQSWLDEKNWINTYKSKN